MALLLKDLSIIDLSNFVKRCYYITIAFMMVRQRKPSDLIEDDDLDRDDLDSA